MSIVVSSMTDEELRERAARARRVAREYIRQPKVGMQLLHYAGHFESELRRRERERGDYEISG
jgi:hypothetical protein